MTGMYPSKVHNTRNGNATFPHSPPLISKLLADSGYECDWWANFICRVPGIEPSRVLTTGYSFWKFSHAPRDDWKTGHDYADWVRENGGDLDELRNGDGHVPTELHQTTWASTRSIEFIRQSRDCPWMLSVNIYDPHPPFIPPESYFEQFDVESMPGPYFRDADLAQQHKLSRVDFQGTAETPEQRNAKEIQAKYYAMIAQIDDQFARILNTLEETGQRDNTVIIFTSDHGESLGDHGLLQKAVASTKGSYAFRSFFPFPNSFKTMSRATP